MRFNQTTYKKFVLPILLFMLVQSNIMPVQADRDDFSSFILKISLLKTYPEAQSMKKTNKSADWFIKKSKKGKPRELENTINKALIEKTKEKINTLCPEGVKLAVDITKIPVYSKSKSKYITNGKAEKGTTRFYQFLGFSIADRQIKFPVSFHLMEQGDFSKQDEIIKKNVNHIINKIKITMVLLDRGYVSSKIVQFFLLLSLPFIIAFRKSDKLNKVFPLLEHPKTMHRDHFFIPHLANTVYRVNPHCWVIRNYKYGNPEVKVNLVIWKLKKNKKQLEENSTLKNNYFIYITSSDVPPEIVYDYYGKRWRIETAYRQIKSIQAKTRVIHPCHRIWLFAVACLIYASWIYRHLPQDSSSVLPEDLLTEELQLMYKEWTYNRIPLRELIEYYLLILGEKR